MKKPADNAPVSVTQNYLKSSQLAARLVRAGNIPSGQLVLDIGAGRGALTKALLEAGYRVQAIELDPGNCRYLKSKSGNNSSFSLYQGDFLQYPLPVSRYWVFSNIPYAITTGIMEKLTKPKNPPLGCYLIMQKQAAQKYCGRSTSQKAALLGPYFAFSLLHNFRRTDFSPAPGVDSVLMRMEKKPEPDILPKESDLYRDFICYCFRYGRKGLERLFSHRQMLHLQKSELVADSYTPATIQNVQWLCLFRCFQQLVPKEKQLLTYRAFSLYKQEEDLLDKRHRGV